MQKVKTNIYPGDCESPGVVWTESFVLAAVKQDVIFAKSTNTFDEHCSHLFRWKVVSAVGSQVVEIAIIKSG